MSQKVMLSDFIQVEQKVELSPGKFLPVRALVLPEFIQLILTYKEAALALYNESQSKTPNYTTVLAAVPELVADIICLGGDLTDQRDSVLKLPASLQLDLLSSIWELSVPDPKKLVVALSKLMGQVQRLAEVQESQSGVVSTPALAP